jgi:alkylhydroperoxidase family enzyme
MADARIPMLSPEATHAAAAEAGMHEAMAKLSVFRVLLRRPRVAKGLSEMLLSLLGGGALDPRLRELVIMRIGWATGSNYEWTQHWRLALDLFGCSEEDLLAVRDWRSAAHFGATERSVLAAVDEILETGTLSDDCWQGVRAALSEDEALELVAAVGTWHWVSQVTRSLEVPLEEGVASWPPDGISPAAAGR